MSADTLTAIIVGFFTVVMGGGSILAVLRSAILKQNNKDLMERVDILEKAKIEYESTIKAHEAKISVLEGVVTGRDLLQQLIEIGNENGAKLQRLLDAEFRRPLPRP